MFSNFKEAKAFCAENKIKMIDFKMVDIDGRWRHLTIPEARFEERLLETGIGFDGSNYGYARVERSDMVLVPILSTAIVDEFAEVPTLSMIGDVMVIDLPDNRPFDQYPRNVVKNAVRYMRTLGIADQMIIGPEFEFHIFDNVNYQTQGNRVSFQIDTSQAAWNTGCQSADNKGFKLDRKAGYHADLPHDITYDLRSKICLLLERFGVKVKYHHHEVGGSGQVEVEVEMGELVEMADKTMLLKYVVKNAALKDGRTATFMPKPLYNEAGNGMHVHMQLFKDRQPIFYDERGYAQLSETALNFIGGLLTHAASLCAFTNPSTNSFKRLVPGFEAPVTLGYATSNRSAVIRIPAYAKAPDQKRFEFRSPDATCNPYYAYAAILMAGIDGVIKKIDPSKQGWGPFDLNLYNLPEDEKAKIKSLPRSLDEALDALETDHEYLTKGGVFPEELIKIWLRKKRNEASRINMITHPAEYEAYYDL
ncbi:MAG: type I glutamate--ammonia ligase [Eubacteriales bacterium]